MICPICKAEGRKSAVSAFPMPTFVPAVFVADQFDEEGRRIMPKPIPRRYDCSCSNGHRFEWEETTRG